MAWSTREVADLADTSVRAVRHYHDVGLLDEPSRRANGYKQYGVEHLVRLVRIKRLTGLGFTLPQIAEMGDSADHPGPALRALDDDLAARINQLQRARDELRTIIEHSAPVDLPATIIPPAAVAKLSDADRAMVVVLTRVLGPRGLQTYAELLQEPADPAEVAFDSLPATADEATRQAIAERLALHIRRTREAHPGLRVARDDAPRGARFAQQAIDEAVLDLYSPAQLDVLRRAWQLVAAEDHARVPGIGSGAMR